MKNLHPWIVRKFAVPVVGFYLFRQMALHRRIGRRAAKRQLVQLVTPIAANVPLKVDAMALYGSQFREFFSSKEDCLKTQITYTNRALGGVGPIERYWAAR